MWTLILTAALAAPGLGVPQTVRGELGARLDDYLTRLESHGYSGAVLVADREGVLLEQGYGLADREAGRPVAPDTVFTCGSITKQFTAAAIVHLQAEGELSVDEWLADHFDDVPEDKQRITLHDLLTHGSGLASDFAGDFDPVSRDEYLRRVLESELLFEPGSGFSYSNAGYSLLAMVIEEVTGRSYEEYLREELFLPAGMRATGYLLPAYQPERLAVGYTGSGRWGTLLERSMAADGPHWALRGNGGMHTTVGDLYRWHQALEGQALFTDDERELLYAPHNPEGPGAPTAYGYGWSIGDSEDGLLVAHNGGNGVFAADFLRFLDAGVTVCITSNAAEHPAWRASEGVGLLARGHAVELPPALLALSPAELEQYAGSYPVPDGGAVLVEALPGGLALSGGSPRAFQLVMGDQPPAGSPTHALLELASDVTRAAAAGELGPLAEAMGRDRAQVEESVAPLFAGLTAELGSLQEVEPLGVQDGSDELRLVVALRFERGRRYLMNAWEEGQLAGLLVGEEPPRRTVRPVDRATFVDHDLRTGRSFRVRFEPGPRGEHGPPAAVVFETWQGEARVPRAAE